MVSTGEVLGYARRSAEDLKLDMHWIPESEYGQGYWKASDPSLFPKISARATAALEFLRQYAGGDSFWTLRAQAVYASNGDNQSSETGARSIGDILVAWANQVEAGISEIAGSRAWAEVSIVSTDLMMQVRRLLEDRKTHPAAAMVLCGAALEIALRAVIGTRGLEVQGRPSLSTYTRLLRTADLITVQDAKDLEQCAGLRNAAAHGDFDALSTERAGLLEQQTNLLLRRLADLEVE
jgi:hypothetical protein